MSSVLQELIRAIELWLHRAKERTPLVNPNLDPVLLVSGIAGTILNAVGPDGKAERVWVRILGAEHEFRAKLWSRFDPSTGKTVSLDEKVTITIPEERFGLYAIDVLDPDMIIGSEGVYYYHDLIVEMIKWGYQEGKTLFGFGYDFRQSNRLQETMDKFAAKLESVYKGSGGRKVNVVTHSMGGLLVKCFLSLHPDIFEKYVKGWITIATPFQGAPGYITASLLSGTSFVEGWEENFFISKWSMHQLLIECPSMYELMATPDFQWADDPLLQMWIEKPSSSGKPSAVFESYKPAEAIKLMAEALKSNKISYGGVDVPLPFNLKILKWAQKTREVMSSAKLPEAVKFYNIYGVNNDTAHSVCYGSERAPVPDLEHIPFTQPKYMYVNGDGSVPVESAKADGLQAVARVAVHADHRGIICDRHVFRVLQHWLRAGEPDPFYNPLNDYVIIPTSFEFERHREKQMKITGIKEEWEIVSSGPEKTSRSKRSELPALVSSFSLSCEGKDHHSSEEARATLVVEQQKDGRQHVQLRAVSIATDA